MFSRFAIVQIVLVMFIVTLSVPTFAATAAATQAGASAPACTNPSWIDVRCFGATGNGTTDDTASINRALSAALADDQPRVPFPTAGSGSPAP